MTELDQPTLLPALPPEAEAAPLAVVDVVYPPLSRDEETFCLALMEFEGNAGKAYRAAFGEDELLPAARAAELLMKPAIAIKIKTLTDAIHENAMISVGAHLNSLARIRDLSIAMGEMKTAYSAERSRGEAVGIYQKHDANNKGKGVGNAVQINITMASKHDADI